jgi:hypothetical protein
MLMGRRPFQGEDVADTMAAMVKDQPDLTQVPAQVRLLLGSCLEKDPKKRLQAIGDMRLLLRDAAPPIAAASQSRFGYATWAVAESLVVPFSMAVSTYSATARRKCRYWNAVTAKRFSPRDFR